MSDDFEGVCQAAHALLLRWAHTPMEEIADATPEELYMKGLTGLIRVFVKNEPHPTRKRLTQTWRIIASVCVILQIAFRVLFAPQNKLEAANWDKIPSKPGINLEMVDAVVAPLVGKPLRAGDVQSWDWSVEEWMMLLDGSRRIALAAKASPGNVVHTSVPGSWAGMVFKAMYILARGVYVSHGRVYAQTVYGIMKSGSYITSSTNSAIRVMMGWLAGCEWIIANGDDAISAQAPDLNERYRELGFLIKEGRDLTFGEPVEFCSQLYDLERKVRVSSNPGKSFFIMCSQVVENQHIELLEQFYRNVGEQPVRSSMMRFLKASGWGSEKIWYEFETIFSEITTSTVWNEISINGTSSSHQADQEGQSGRGCSDETRNQNVAAPDDKQSRSGARPSPEPKRPSQEGHGERQVGQANY